MNNIEDMIDYEDLNVIDTLIQYKNVVVKQDFYDIKAGTKLAWLACNFNEGKYSFAYRSNDQPNQWLRGKIEVAFGRPS